MKQPVLISLGNRISGTYQLNSRMLILVIPLIFLNSLIAQSNEAKLKKPLTYFGFVFDATGKGIEGVNVFQIAKGDTTLITFTDEKGFFYIQTADTVDALRFYVIGYEAYNYKINDALDIGKQISIELILKPYSLPEITVSINKPIRVYNNKDVWIFDFLLNEAGILLLGKEKSRYFLMKINFNGDTISFLNHPYKAESLLKDAFKNRYISVADSMIQIIEMYDSLNLLYSISNMEFNQKIRPIVGFNESIVVVKNVLKYNQEILYTLFNRSRQEYALLKRITDKDQLSIMNDYLKVMGRASGKYNITDSIELISYREDFKNNMIFNHLYAKPIYSPFFCLDTCFLLFDFINDSLYKYDDIGRLISQKYIRFHYSKGFKKVHFDEYSKMFYLEFNFHGKIFLSKVDVESGTITGSQEIKVDFLFPEKITIYNGSVFFLYRKRYSSFPDKKTLYKLQLQI